MVGSLYGWVTIISPERRYTQGWSGAYVLTQCRGCQAEQWTNWSNLSRGKTAGCQPCSQPLNPHAKTRKTLRAAQSRCTKPSDRYYRHYGGRGIQFNFDSLDSAEAWVVENLGDAAEGMSLDRVNNDGHYEPGNLRWASMSQQCRNQRRTRLSYYDPAFWPYAELTVRRKLREGQTREQIIEDAQLAVEERRKGWRTIEERLQSMTYSMPGHIIVSPSQTS